MTIPDDASARMDNLFVDMFFGRQCSVIVMLDDLEINQSIRVGAENRNQPKAHSDGSCLCIPSHGLPARLETILNSFPTGPCPWLRRTTWSVVIGINPRESFAKLFMSSRRELREPKVDSMI